LWELCAERLELVEEILRQWGTLEIDVVIAPGFAMPAVPLGYPAYLEFTCNYTEVYNLLNFPAGSLTVGFSLSLY
jgi:Asp-tRNA(Asn)/Glu-tRNA(Gln) amidotransferase A subunit family amidase